MDMFDFRVVTPGNSVFNFGDLVKFESRDGNQFILVKESGGNEYPIFEVFDVGSKPSIDVESNRSIVLYSGRISRVEAPGTEIGYIKIGVFENYYVWFDVRLYGSAEPIGPRSGSGGGLRS